MRPPTRDPMTSAERRAGIALAGVFALRMLGLFLILPVFAVHARELPSGHDTALIGLTLGAYGITQACLQIVYGAASDRYGRKPVIVAGLLLFALGSFIAAAANDLPGILVGRALQGAGAISAAVTALAADLTREQHLTKVMSMIGGSIGLVFALSMVAAPLLFDFVGLSGMFALTGVLSLLAIGVVWRIVPAAPAIPRQPGWAGFRAVLAEPQLQRMNAGVFILHLVQTAMWVLLPAALIDRGGLTVGAHWQVYLPAVLLSLALMVPAVIAAERQGQMRPVFLTAIAVLGAAQLGFAYLADGLPGLFFWLLLFFVAFNILEATQPSLIARLAAPHAKGAALGVYNTLQSLGLFAGGALGGALAAFAGPQAVWLACALLAVVWLAIASGLKVPARRSGPPA